MTGEKGGYGLVYSEIMRSKHLTSEAKAIYAYLCTFAGAGETCYPSVGLMCDELQMSPDRFYRHLRPLLSAGVVKKTQERNGNRWGRTIYTLCHYPGFAHPQNNDAENPVSCFEETEPEDAQNTGPQSMETNSTRPNNTSLNSTTPDNTSAARICEAMNAAKAAAHQKGRLKVAGSYMLQDLIEAGTEWAEIERLSQEYLSQARRIIDWFSLRDYCAKRLNIHLGRL